MIEALEGLEGIRDRGYFFVQEGGREVFLSYADLYEDATRLAGALREMGLKKGDRIGLILPDNQEFIRAFFAAVWIGALPVPLYPPLALGRLEAWYGTAGRIVATAGASAILASRRLLPLMWPLTEKARSLKHIVALDALKTPSAVSEPADVLPEDPVFLQFTSGSTSDPKGVVVTHKSLVANCHGIMHEGLNAHPYQDRGLSWLPLYHDMGLIGFVIAPIFIPLSVVFIPTLMFMKRPLLWMDLLTRHRATITFAPNFAYSLIARRATDVHLERWDLSALRIAGCGAEPIAASAMRAFQDRLAAAGLGEHVLVPSYGMAEATLAITFRPLGTLWRSERISNGRFQKEGIAVPAEKDEEALEFVSCGKPFRGHHVRIVDEDGHVLPDRAVGEIAFQGPSVTAGYYRNPDESARAFAGGWLLTGDLGYLADGELFVTGRRKDLVIINGRNYVPQAIEWVVQDVPGVRRGNVVAFARPGSQGTEELVIVCEVRGDDHDAIAKGIRRAVSNALSIPVGDIVFLAPGTLPKTSSGKIQRRKTREGYILGTLGAEGTRLAGEGSRLGLSRHLMRAMVSRVKHGVRTHWGEGS